MSATPAIAHLEDMARVLHKHGFVASADALRSGAIDFGELLDAAAEALDCTAILQHPAAHRLRSAVANLRPAP